MNKQYGGRSAASRSQCMLVKMGCFEDVGFGWWRCPCGEHKVSIDGVYSTQQQGTVSK